MNDSIPAIRTDTALVQGQGWAIYSPESFISRMARDKKGELHRAKIKVMNNWFSLDPWQCLEILKLNADVFSIVTQRAQIISGLEYKVIPSRSIEDEISEDLKMTKWLFEQIDPLTSDLWKRIKLSNYRKKLFETLGPFELSDDLSNFDGALRVWSKFMKRQMNDSASEIEDWLQVTRRFIIDEGSGEYVLSNTQGFQDFVIQWVTDMLIHGRGAIQNPNDFFDGLWVLPGGSVFPVPGAVVGQPEYYVQLMYGMSGYGMQEPKFFFPSDIAMSMYMPNSAVVYGMKPLDAIINQVMENFNFASYMAEHANQEKPPQYVIFVVDSGLTLPDPSLNDFIKTDAKELERQETILNEKQKDKAIRVLKQGGTDAKLFDLSKENTIPDHMAREERHSKIIGRVFGATPNEMGETDTGGMIAKAGADAQHELYNRQSIRPIAASLEQALTFEIFPRRWGSMTDNGGRPIYWQFQYIAQDSEMEKFAKAEAATKSNSVSANWIRENILGIDPTTNPADDEISKSPEPNSQDIMNTLKELRKRL